MLDSSGNEYLSEYINKTINTPNKQEEKALQIKKLEALIEKLKKAKEINLSIQNSMINKIHDSQQKMDKIESLLDKLNSIKKSKPKKHMKYSNYIQL